jgi:phosphotransferase system  glucose/maltose/N-acetylglucosamine-specific IIC component
MMEQRRIVFIVIAALVVIGLLFGVGSSMQRNAWMEGYTMGRLTAAAGVDGALAPMMPYAPVAVGYPQHGPSFGGVLFLFFGAGLFFLIASRFWHRARWQEWAAQSGQPGETRHGPPWMHHGRGCWGHHSPPAQGSASPSPTQAETKPTEEAANR